ncbi:MAG: fructosamine kinase family protein [Alphaproteobacteria bacterium]
MALSEAARAAVERATGAKVKAVRGLGGGCVADVRLVELEGGLRVVAKVPQGTDDLSLEAWMLDYLRATSRLPVPRVLHADADLLVMEYLESGDPIDETAERHAAELLAALHAIGAPEYGLERNTLIGGLPQPNAQSRSWVSFFRDRRLLFMAGEARAAGRLPARLHDRIERFADAIGEFLEEPERPGLIHGDMWGGNVLVKRGRIAGFIDPAIYYADPEIELAFSTLFSTFGAAFFARYAELRPIRPGFFETRRDVYNLYPLLVHVRLFGGGYAGAVERTLDRFGY